MSDYLKRWFLVEYDGNIEKRQYECMYLPETKEYLVKMGCFRETVPEDKVYATEFKADAKLQELLADLV